MRNLDFTATPILSKDIPTLFVEWPNARKVKGRGRRCRGLWITQRWSRSNGEEQRGGLSSKLRMTRSLPCKELICQRAEKERHKWLRIKEVSNL